MASSKSSRINKGALILDSRSRRHCRADPDVEGVMVLRAACLGQLRTVRQAGPGESPCSRTWAADLRPLALASLGRNDQASRSRGGPVGSLQRDGWAGHSNSGWHSKALTQPVVGKPHQGRRARPALCGASGPAPGFTHRLCVAVSVSDADSPSTHCRARKRGDARVEARRRDHLVWERTIGQGIDRVVPPALLGY